MSEIEIAATLRAAAQGDAEAWRELVEAYSGRVFGLMVKQCRDRDLAEELTQATFVKVVEKLGGGRGIGDGTQATGGTDEGGGAGEGGGYEERGKFEPWLFRIAMNKLRDEMRRRKRRASTVRLVDESAGPSYGTSRAAASSGGSPAWLAASSEAGRAGERPVDVLDRQEEVQRLQRAIEQLPEADRTLLHLRHTAGLSFAEIAATLEQPLGTVLARGHRALGKLRKIMEPVDG